MECTAEKEKVTYGREFFYEVEYASYFLEIEKIGVFFIRTRKKRKERTHIDAKSKCWQIFNLLQGARRADARASSQSEHIFVTNTARIISSSFYL